MADVRAGSQASYASQSQYSESIVLNPDDGEPDLFKTEDTPLKGPYPTKVNIHRNIATFIASQSVFEIPCR